MNAAIQAEVEHRLVDLAVADAPTLTAEQIIEIRRVLKPQLHAAANPLRSVRHRTARRAA